MTDCNKIQANNLACNKISLTDKWKKVELKAGYYYVKNEFGNIFPSDYSEEYDSINDCGVLGFWNEVSEITEVIEKVPSYEEYLSLTYAKEEDEKIIAEYEEENTKLKTENKWYSEQLNEAVKKIDKLKEQQKLTSDCKTLAQTLLKVSPEHKAWLEKNYKEYL